MAAAAATRRPPPPPIFLLSGLVDMGALTDDPGGGWTKVECASKKAYGCGEHGQEEVEGLKLYVRLGDNQLLTSSLAIRMSDEALRRFESELELGVPISKGTMTTNGIVEMAEEQDLTVIFLVFSRPFFGELAYYLVYDHVDASLSMIKYQPDLYVRIGTTKPVPKRHGSDFELFLMSRLSEAPGHVLCVCTPETRANPASDDGTGPWQIKTPHMGIQWPFLPTVAFSSQGKGFWADLTRGLVYCDLHTATGNPAVEFGFIGLPREYLGQTLDPLAMKLTRTMSCVRDSIWFVCIHYAVDYAADDLVKIWRLNVPGGKWQEAWWEEVEVVPVIVLWGLDSFREAGLPQVPLEYPILLPDGALCVTLPNFHQRNCLPSVDNICIFKLHGERGLLWHGVVHHYRFSEHVVCPSNFLQRKHGSSETKVDEHCPAAALAALAVGE